jgi:hypothetical protein
MSIDILLYPLGCLILIGIIILISCIVFHNEMPDRYIEMKRESKHRIEVLSAALLFFSIFAIIVMLFI